MYKKLFKKRYIYTHIYKILGYNISEGVFFTITQKKMCQHVLIVRTCDMERTWKHVNKLQVYHCTVHNTTQNPYLEIY